MSSTDPQAPSEVDPTDEDFTDIEFDEQSADAPDAITSAQSAPEVQRQLGDAHDQANQLRAYADELTKLDDAELSEHVEFYQRTHADLQRALSDIDNA